MTQVLGQKKTDATKILMIEIPTSGEASNQNYSLAHAKLTEAKMAMLRGEWRQTVALSVENALKLFQHFQMTV